MFFSCPLTCHMIKRARQQSWTNNLFFGRYFLFQLYLFVLSSPFLLCVCVQLQLLSLLIFFVFLIVSFNKINATTEKKNISGIFSMVSLKEIGPEKVLPRFPVICIVRNKRINIEANKKVFCFNFFIFIFYTLSCDLFWVQQLLNALPSPS